MLQNLSKKFFKIRHLFFCWCIKKTLADCLHALAALQTAYFNCYIKLDYFTKQTIFEQIIYKRRAALLQIVSGMYKLKEMNQAQNKKFCLIFYKIRYLCEIVFSLHQLRFRITDPAIFETSLFELQALQADCTNILLRVVKLLLQRKKIVAAPLLSRRIQAFESIYQHILQVVTPQPRVFLFFIRQLYAFNDEVESLNDMIISYDVVERLDEKICCHQ